MLKITASLANKSRRCGISLTGAAVKTIMYHINMKQFFRKLPPFVHALGITLLILGGAYVLFGRGPESVHNNQPIQSHRQYEVEMVSALEKIQPNQTTKIVYKIKDDQKSVLKNFDVVHEKIMHFIIVRKDLQYFQHLHPEFDKATGEFSIPVTFATDGEYRMFADFTPLTSQMRPDGDKLPVTVYQDIKIGNLSHYKPLRIGNTERVKTYGDYQVTIIPNSNVIVSKNNQNFSFEIKKNGQLVTNLETYLGALGHTVVLREVDLQFIHAHATQKAIDPQTGKINFAITFPEIGDYKLFSQFQHQGDILTTDFVISVEQNVNQPTQNAPERGNGHQ